MPPALKVRPTSHRQLVRCWRQLRLLSDPVLPRNLSTSLSFSPFCTMPSQTILSHSEPLCFSITTTATHSVMGFICALCFIGLTAPGLLPTLGPRHTSTSIVHLIVFAFRCNCWHPLTGGGRWRRAKLTAAGSGHLHSGTLDLQQLQQHG